MVGFGIRLRDILIVAASVAVVTVVRALLSPVVGSQLPFLLWIFAVIVSALLTGSIGGVAATLLSAASAAFVVLEPVGSFRVSAPHDRVALGIFILVGVITSRAVGALRVAGVRAEGAVRALQLREARLRALIERGSDVLTISDREGRIVFASPSITSVCGHTVEEFRERHPFERIHPDDQSRCRATFEELLDRPGHTVVLQHRYLHGDGSWHWLEGTFTNRFDDPAIGGLVANFRDITRRKEAERRDALLAEVSHVLGATLDYVSAFDLTARLVVDAYADWCVIDVRGNDGRIERVAAAHRDPEQAARIAALRDRFAPSRYRSEEILAVLESGRPILRRKIPEIVAARLEGASEELRDLIGHLGLRSYIITPLRTPSGPVGAVTIVSATREFEDVDLAFAEELGRRAGYAIENARLYQEAQVASRAKDDFLAVLSHELRTPLTALLGWATMLKTGPLDEETVRTGILAIEQSARAQARLVDDLLDVSRIVSGRLSLDQVAVDLRALVEETLQMTRATAEGKGIELRTDLIPAPVVVVGDVARLRQVVWNILANAIKFTPPERSVTTSLRVEEDAAVLTIRDEGEGIAPEFLPFVFDRFRQADTNTRQHGGMGLGLAIAKQLVELHGGRIEASSEGRGHGAAFTIRIPLAAQPPREEPPT